MLGDLLAGVGEVPATPEPLRARLPSLFADTGEFVHEALREVYRAARRRRSASATTDAMLALTAPDDLIQRLSDLPRSYLAAQRVNDDLRLRLTFDKAARAAAPRRGAQERHHHLAASRLRHRHPPARRVAGRQGPDPPRATRGARPRLHCGRDPVFLVQGVLCDAHGRPVVVEYLAVDGLPDETDGSVQWTDALAAAGVGPSMPNPGLAAPLDELQAPATRRARRRPSRLPLADVASPELSR